MKHTKSEPKYYLIEKDELRNVGIAIEDFVPRDQIGMEIRKIPRRIRSRKYLSAMQKPGCYVTCPFNDLCANDIDKIKSIEAEATRKAIEEEREKMQKQWQKLEDYIDANSPWVPGTDDRVTDSRELIATVRTLWGEQKTDGHS